MRIPNTASIRNHAVWVGALVALIPTARAADLHVPASYPTIQAAVDAAAGGDTIRIAPGVYNEQAQILGKNLTLVGQPGTILRAFPGMEPAPQGIGYRCLIYIYDAAEVYVRGLTFEGDQLSGQIEQGPLGIYFLRSGGSVENCRFTGFREKTPGTAGGGAIQLINDFGDSPRLQARITGNTIVDTYLGIYLAGSQERVTYDFSIADNTISGVGPTSNTQFLIGIAVQDGAVGEVVRNTISGFSYNGDPSIPGPFAWGILANSQSVFSIRPPLPLQPIVFEANMLLDNQVHMALIAADDSIVRNNTFAGTAPGVGPSGLSFSGQRVQVTGNSFRDMPLGIEMFAGDDTLGDASDAQLVDNRFCEVATQLVSGPGASYSEQGTIACPFPPPELNIAKAVLLSWPEVEEGFSVEAAPTMNGPWYPIDATYFRQDGTQAVAVPEDTDRQFFRLVKP